MQDAGKQRPYYGRVLGAWGHVPRKSTCILPDGRGLEPGQGPSAHPPTQASSRRIYVKHVQTTPTPVHSRDAPCVRPACLRSQYACLSNRVRACACMFIEPCASCVPRFLAMCVLWACAPNVQVCRSVCVLWPTCGDASFWLVRALRAMSRNGPGCLPTRVFHRLIYASISTISTSYVSAGEAAVESATCCTRRSWTSSL